MRRALKNAIQGRNPGDPYGPKMAMKNAEGCVDQPWPFLPIILSHSRLVRGTEKTVRRAASTPLTKEEVESLVRSTLHESNLHLDEDPSLDERFITLMSEIGTPPPPSSWTLCGP